MTHFTLGSPTPDPGDVQFLSILRDTRKQLAALRLYADGYLVWEYRLDGLLSPLKERWNRLAWKVNRHAVRTRTSAQGIPIVRRYTVVPKFTLHACRVREFVARVRQEDTPGAPPQDAIAS